MVFLAAPHRILGDAKGKVKAIEVVKTRLGAYDNSGRRRPIPTDEVQRFECDTVILAVGETFDLDFCSRLGVGAEGTRDDQGRPILAGDEPARLLRRRRCDYGRLECVERHGGGKQAARKIDERLMDEWRWEQLFPKIEYDLRVPENPSESRRHGGHELVAVARAKSDSLGFFGHLSNLFIVINLSEAVLVGPESVISTFPLQDVPGVLLSPVRGYPGFP